MNCQCRSSQMFNEMLIFTNQLFDILPKASFTWFLVFLFRFQYCIKKYTFFFSFTPGNIWRKCFRKCESCLWWGSHWGISSYCHSINSVISPIEGQKSNFKICILRIFILATLPWIRDVVCLCPTLTFSTVACSSFSLSSFLPFFKQERWKPHFVIFQLRNLWDFCSARKKKSHLPISYPLPPRKILSPPKQHLKILFFFPLCC